MRCQRSLRRIYVAFATHCACPTQHQPLGCADCGLRPVGRLQTPAATSREQTRPPQTYERAKRQARRAKTQRQQPPAPPPKTPTPAHSAPRSRGPRADRALRDTPRSPLGRTRAPAPDFQSRPAADDPVQTDLELVSAGILDRLTHGTVVRLHASHEQALTRNTCAHIIAS